MSIQVLDQNTINKIAAGEVIERPASIVKELVENAIDAKATAVTIEIKDGGISFVRITDNGCGINKSELPLAFLRHSTSKIKSIEDLAAVSSLGFRGEALSSIAAVAQVELITRTKESFSGSRYVIEGGTEITLEEVGAPEGTTFIIRNLFYNTPVRRKFLKSAATEAGYVNALIEHLALSHPDVSFRFINNNQNKLHTSGNASLKDIIYHVYGRDISANLIDIKGKTQDIEIEGFIGKPVVSRGNRSYENYYINGRYIKSSVISKAIEEAYKGFIMMHKYPFTAMHFKINPEIIDVNVHPTKMELRFSQNEFVYEFVMNTVRSALTRRELIPNVEFDSGKKGNSGQTAPTQRISAPTASALNQASITANISTESNTSGYTSVFRADSVTKPLPAVESNVPGTDKGQHNRPVCNSYSQPVGRNLSTQSQPVEKNTVLHLQPVKDTVPHLQPLDGLPAEPAGAEFKKADVSPEVSDIKKEDISPEVSGIKKADISPEVSENKKTEVLPATSDIQKQVVISELKKNEDEIYSVIEKLGRTSERLPEPFEIKRSNEMLKEDDAASLYGARTEQMQLFSEKKLLDRQNRNKIKVIGQLFDTYWMIEFEDKLFIMDQHAAHEKILFEKMMRLLSEKQMDTQMLNPPIILSLNMREEEILKEHIGVFESLGYEIEEFGGREYKVTGIPANLPAIDDKGLLIEILDGLVDDNHGRNPDTIMEKVASMSCKAAVKGNSRLSAMEAKALIDELLDAENPYNCPHGRPTLISMTKYELEKKFKRIL